MKQKLSMMAQTRRDWQNVREAITERPLDTLLGIAIAIGVAAFFVAPWLLD